MNKSVKYLIITLLVLVDAGLTMAISPTFGRQVPFNEWAWKHHPSHKVRYYMSKSIMEWLNKEKPSRETVLEKLGKEESDKTLFPSASNHLTYGLKSTGFLGITTLEIVFNTDGTFKKASIQNPD